MIFISLRFYLPPSFPCAVFLGSVHGLPLWRTFYVEGCLSVCLSIFIRDGSTTFHYQMVFAILLEIIIPHL
jgi:hypothetical protein